MYRDACAKVEAGGWKTSMVTRQSRPEYSDIGVTSPRRWSVRRIATGCTCSSAGSYPFMGKCTVENTVFTEIFTYVFFSVKIIMCECIETKPFLRYFFIRMARIVNLNLAKLSAIYLTVSVHQIYYISGAIKPKQVACQDYWFTVVYSIPHHCGFLMEHFKERPMQIFQSR